MWSDVRPGGRNANSFDSSILLRRPKRFPDTQEPQWYYHNETSTVSPLEYLRSVIVIIEVDDEGDFYVELDQRHLAPGKSHGISSRSCRIEWVNLRVEITTRPIWRLVKKSLSADVLDEANGILKKEVWISRDNVVTKMRKLQKIKSAEEKIKETMEREISKMKQEWKQEKIEMYYEFEKDKTKIQAMHNFEKEEFISDLSAAYTSLASVLTVIVEIACV